MKVDGERGVIKILASVCLKPGNHNQAAPFGIRRRVFAPRPWNVQLALGVLSHRDDPEWRPFLGTLRRKPARWAYGVHTPC